MFSGYVSAYDLQGGAIYHTSTVHACMPPKKVDKSLQACYGGKMGEETSQCHFYYLLGYSLRFCDVVGCGVTNLFDGSYITQVCNYLTEC